MKKKLVILGDVHDVGYRPFLLGIAESLEIERFFADNIKINGKRAVYALVDSSEDKVRAFIQIASSKFPEDASVDEVEVEDYQGNVMKTENYYRYLSAMQLSKIATYGGRMLKKQDAMLAKQDAMLKKQGETTSEIRKVREEVAGVSSRLDKTNSLLEERFNRMEREIERIKKALTRAGIEV